jgi:hypothetical protein
MFALNTLAKLVNIAIALQKVAVVLHTGVMALFTAAVGTATGALKLFRIALITTGIGAVLVGLGFLAEWMINASTATDKADGSLTRFNRTQEEYNRIAGVRTPFVPTVNLPNLPDLSNTPSAQLPTPDPLPTPEAAPTGLQAWLDSAANDAKKVRKRLALIGAGLSEAVADSILASSDPINAANETLAMIASGGAEAVKTITRAFRRSEAGQALAAQRAEERARKEKERLDRQKAALQSFNDAVQQLYGQIKDSILSAFKLPDLGNSINSITRNMTKLLAKTRSFATNIAQLGQLGLNSTLLQQVISAGPMAGSQLASAIVSGGAAFVSELNAAYSEFGSLASGIAGVGTAAAFANPQTVNNYSIAVTGGLATSADVGAQVVKAIRTYERQSGAGWRA